MCIKREQDEKFKNHSWHFGFISSLRFDAILDEGKILPSSSCRYEVMGRGRTPVKIGWSITKKYAEVSHVNIEYPLYPKVN